MNEIITKDDIKIENMIYEINGKQVMLDSDLAKIYNCKNGTKEIISTYSKIYYILKLHIYKYNIMTH